MDKEKDILEEIKKNTDFDFGKMDIVKLGYYGAALVLMFFPLYSLLGYSMSLFSIAFNSLVGFLYLLVIIAGAATLVVKPVQGLDKLGFMVAPIAELILLFAINSQMMGIPPSLGFWLSTILHLAAIAYYWYPTVLKMVNEKK